MFSVLKSFKLTVCKLVAESNKPFIEVISFVSKPLISNSSRLVHFSNAPFNDVILAFFSEVIFTVFNVGKSLNIYSILISP